MDGMNAFREKRKPDFRQFRVRAKQMVDDYLEGVDAEAGGGR